MVNHKHAFWQAFVFTVIVFIVGIAIGFFFEMSRTSSVSDNIYNSEISLLDEQMRTQAVTDFNVSCNISTSSLFSFADAIYTEAQQLENYDRASNFQSTLEILHRRYDIMRVMLWSESSEIRSRCKEKFHTAVYFYSYKSNDVGVRAQQLVYSRILEDIKARHGSDLLLIPIAADMNLTSVDVLLKSYNVTQTPAILIDEKKVLTGEITSSQLEQDIFHRNN